MLAVFRKQRRLNLFFLGNKISMHEIVGRDNKSNWSLEYHQ